MLKGAALGFGIAGVSAAVIGSVFSLPIYPTWLRAVLFLALLAAYLVSISTWPEGSKVRRLGKRVLLKKYWLYTLPLIASGSVVIYAMIGIILGNMEWIYPRVNDFCHSYLTMK